tara:strand:- start:281 stop:523 length:243 start_codon:yes stop_codon:yes gene_type:complete
MDIKINCEENISLDYVKLQKMAFLYNALEDGWTITKNDNNHYVFKKKHESKKEVYLDSYLHRFMKDNFDINKIILNNNAN